MFSKRIKLAVFFGLGALAMSMTTSTNALACDEDPLVSLNRLMAVHGVQAREPVLSDRPFTADGEPVTIFIDVYNPQGPAGELTVYWLHEDRDREFFQTIDYGQSPRWRTWVTRRMPAPYAGAWHVEVVDSNGTHVGEIRFDVEPLPPQPQLSDEVASNEIVEGC